MCPTQVFQLYKKACQPLGQPFSFIQDFIQIILSINDWALEGYDSGSSSLRSVIRNQIICDTF